MVVLRNVLERRGELAALRAVGFSVRAVGWLVLSEHGLLLTLGVGGGALAATVAVIPALKSQTSPPYVLTLLLLIAVAASGLAWAALATAWSLRGRLLEALRDE
jgi:ABC-type antimicrobial peptide transport system permease subunit